MSRIIGSEEKPKTPYVPPEIIPIGDRVVVQADVIPELTKGGIALPNRVVGKRASRMGTVIAVGPGALRTFAVCTYSASGEPQYSDRQPMQCKVGDRVVLPAIVDNVQMDFDDEQSELAMLPESQLLAILP